MECKDRCVNTFTFVVLFSLIENGIVPSEVFDCPISIGHSSFVYCSMLSRGCKGYA